MNEEEVLTEYEILKDFGLSKNEIYTYLTVLSMDLCEAKEICRRTHIPSSKIYNILDRLENFGLIEIQQSRPKRYRPLSLDSAIENLKAYKKREYQMFKAKLPRLKTLLQSRVKTSISDSLFWNVSIGESNIFNRHISRFRFVDFIGMICIDYTMLMKMTTNSNMAQEISLDFKKKKITTKLIIAYETAEQKSQILNWVYQRPRDVDSKNQIRLIKEKISIPFGLFDLNKVILLMRHPVRSDEFLLSIYMINKPLYEDLIPYFDGIWNRAEVIPRN
ncbi:MAG: TrmB family transcriptional regulator [Candidatus Helarchaeota archaeon]